MTNIHSFNTPASLATKLVHAGEKPDPITGAIAPVLVRTKTYKQPHFGVEAEYQYARGKNPTRAILEEKLATLEDVGGGETVHAAVFASGNAAVTSLLLTLGPGDHIIFCKEVYGGTYRLVEKVFSKFGIAADYIDFNAPDAKELARKALRPGTKYIFVETVSNPSLHVVDLDLVREISRELGVPFVVDATFTPPCTLRSFEYGAETIVHSLSKYCAGHNDTLAGAVITKNKELYEQLKFLQRTVGATLSPDECYRVIQGLKTLELRWKRVTETAGKVSEYLRAHESVSRVSYPGLGGVVAFEIKGDPAKFVEGAGRSGVIIYGESLASPESILAYPAWMSHRALPKEEREKLGITDKLFRFSVGFEDTEDILSALAEGFKESEL